MLSKHFGSAKHRHALTIIIFMSAAALFLIGAKYASSQVRSGTTLDANRIVLRRTDGAIVGEIRVEGEYDKYDVTLRDPNGVIRLSISGLDGVNIPAYSAMTLHDPEGRERVNVIANEKHVGVSLASSWTSKEVSYVVPGPTATRASVTVDNETGKLTFFDDKSQPIYSIPPK